MKNTYKITDIKGRFLCWQVAQDSHEAVQFARTHNPHARFAVDLSASGKQQYETLRDAVRTAENQQ